jgi:large subunit ribosomal protein L1
MLGVDPRKPNQTVRGAVTLPHGTGKETRVAVFARGAEAEAALAAGAHRVGAEDLLADIQAGKLDFERLIATPDMMPLVGRVARILGPRGLMPNPKLGTITKDTAPAVRASKGGQVQYRAYKDGQVLAGLGKVNFTHTQLMENLRAFMIAVGAAKPEGAKGKYVKQAYLSSTMGIGVPITTATIDPSNGRFMLITEEEKVMLARTEAEAAAGARAAAAAAEPAAQELQAAA